MRLSAHQFFKVLLERLPGAGWAARQDGLLRSISATFLVRSAAIVIGLGTTVFFARLLGPEQYGQYVYVLAWISVLSVPMGMGLPDYLLRESASNSSSENNGIMLAWADRRLVVAGAITVVVVVCIVLLVYGATGTGALFLIASPMIVIGNLAAIRQSVLRGLGHIVASQWPGLLAAPLIAALIVGVAALMTEPTAVWLMVGTVVAASVVVFVSNLLLGSVEATAERIRRSILPALPFALIGALHLINAKADLLMIGAFLGTEQSGVYAIALRCAEFVSFPLLVTNLVIGPKIASMYSKRSMDDLQRVLTDSSRIAFVVALPVAAVTAFGSSTLLEFLVGGAYVRGGTALTWLAVGQGLNVMFGSVGLVLNMCHHERLSIWGVGVAAVLNVVLNALLIPRLGILGAAISTTTSLICWNILLWYWVTTKLKLRPDVIGSIGMRPGNSGR